MTKFFTATDADPAVLSGKTVAVIGYGNQGRAQAINLRRARHDLTNLKHDTSHPSAGAEAFAGKRID